MNATFSEKRFVPAGLEMRVLTEGYGPGAWHGPNLKAAVAEVTVALAFKRPAPGRHNIAEIALHHAYCVRTVRGQITGANLERFVLEGDDWFPLSDESQMTWSKILTVVEDEQNRLTAAVDDLDSGRVVSPLAADERFKLVLGITCHAVYHAGQVQLIKRLVA